MTEKSTTKYKQKWITVLYEVADYKPIIMVLLHHHNQDNIANAGYLKMDYDDYSNTWIIKDIEIDRKFRGQNYGAAMILRALKKVYTLRNEHTINGVSGQIAAIYTDRTTCKGLDAYSKIRGFYERLGFYFESDMIFKKVVNCDSLLEWCHTIEAVIENKDLRFDLAISRQLLDSLEVDINKLKSHWLGRHLIKHR
ncbi:TPA: hypothetical protein SGW21_002273 [Staphylococcus aureus]|nr:hypothetical protein [Staphylococcus aureus]HDJ5786376.1 hypothetical protein [Staphylococcus aureus]HEH3546699.1 hypothetical protein [Staphylococcus aureus]